MPSIDLRPSLLEVRNQGRRQSCLAFASSAAHEYHAAPGEYLSVEYLYFHSVARMPGQSPNFGTTIAAAAAALAQEGQPVEAAWPYSPVPVAPWTPPAITGPIRKATMQPGAFTFEETVAGLDQGKPVILGLVITDGFFCPNGYGVISFTPNDVERGAHAVLAVGHGKTAAGEHALLIRNSWGEGWGLAGYAWLSRPYVEAHLHETALLA